MKQEMQAHLKSVDDETLTGWNKSLSCQSGVLLLNMHQGNGTNTKTKSITDAIYLYQYQYKNFIKTIIISAKTKSITNSNRSAKTFSMHQYARD